jgi:hypothetical protein
MAETPAQSKLVEVPSRAARGNALNRACSSGRTLTVIREEPIVFAVGLMSGPIKVKKGGTAENSSRPFTGRELLF